jgi:hypothetical protein
MVGPDEWWLQALARTLPVSPMQRRDWAVRGWLHARKSPAPGFWMVWAAVEEVARLRPLLVYSQRGMNGYPGW